MHRTPLVVAGLLCGALASYGCGGESATTPPPDNPFPVLVATVPAQLEAAVGAATISVSGQGFVAASQAKWNGADRPTRFVSATALSVDLSASDLGAIGSGVISVVNPSPGGGASAPLTVTIARARPRIKALTPSRVPVGTSVFIVSIIGSGFTRTSTVLWNSQTTSAFFVSDTLLRLTGNFASTGIAATYSIVVRNTATEGGDSDPAVFTVENPAPTFSSITPDTAYVGSAFALTVRGGGLVATSIVNWNGAPRPTTWTNGTLVAQIAASDVVASGSASITVTNPSPGGGTSAAASLRIVERPPRITAFGPPATLVAGAGARTVTITGTAFNASSTVRVDGQAHPAQFVSSTAMSLPLSASEVASPRSIAIQVVNPGESGPSNVAVLPVLPTGASMDVTAVIQLPNNAIVYDPQRRVLYASIPSSVPTRGNTITKIDPATGAIGASVDVGIDPGRMAISDDARFLYVILNGAPSVVRVDLTTFTKDIEIPLTGTQPMRGNDVAVIPGAPRSVVIARRIGGSTYAGVAIYDDATPRPLIDNEFSGPDRLAITATRIYGVNTATSANGLQWLDITPSGVRRAVQTIPPVGICCEVRLDAGRLYTSAGRVVDPEKMTIYGTLSDYGDDDVRPDAARGRVHTIGIVAGLRTYETTSLTLIGSNANQQLYLLRKLVRFDVDGLAVGGGDRIVILRGSLIGP